MQTLKTATHSGLFFLVNNQQALLAAERLAARIESGVRFCCDTREQLTVAQGRRRDLASESRKAHLRSVNAKDHADYSITAPDSTPLASDEDADTDLLEFEQASDDFDATVLFDSDDDADGDDGEQFDAHAAEQDFELALG